MQGLDGEAHKHRKRLFMSLLTEDSVAELVRLSEAHWQAAIEAWQRCDRVVLMPEVQTILTRAVANGLAYRLPRRM